jgi:hypothetical protein
MKRALAMCFVWVVAAIVLAAPATAQEPRASIEGTVRDESGVPKSTIMSEKNINFFPFGRGNLGRTPAFSQVDLLLQQDFRLPSNMRVTIGLNAINFSIRRP